MTDASTPADRIWHPLPGSSPVTVEHHVNGQCRWPVGHHGAHVFCALPVYAENADYCEVHHVFSVRVLPAKA
jgi:hypothetical protein